MTDFIPAIKKTHIFFAIIAFIIGLLSAKLLIHVADNVINPPVSVYFSPNNASMPLANPLQVLIDSGANSIGFVHVEVLFDNTKVQLNGDPVPSNLFKTVVQKSNKDEANSTGRIVLVLGLSTDDINNPPSGTFSIADLPFVPLAGSGETNISIDPSNVQIVNLTPEKLQTNLSSAVLTFPTPTATPSVNTINMFFANFPTNALVNNTFTTDLFMNTNNINVVGTDLMLNYDKDKLTLNSVDTSTFTQVKNQVIDNTNGKLALTLFQNTSDPVITGNNLQLLKLHFTAKLNGQASIDLSPDTVTAGTDAIGQNLTTLADNNVNIAIGVPVTPSPTSSPTFTPSPTPSPSPTPVVKDADINQDGNIDIADYLLLFQYYGQTNPSIIRTDINKDGVVNIKDYALLYESFEF